MGITQTNRAGLGSMSKKVFSKVGSKGKRDMVSEEGRMFKEELRTASAVTQAKQCAWTKWNDIEPIKLLWKSLIAMELLVISFLLCSTYELLPNATNLKLWGYTDSDLCLLFKSDRGTLHHILSACPQSLQIYTRRHNKVLAMVRELLRAQCEKANQQPVTAKVNVLWGNKKIPIWSYWTELVTGKFQPILRHLYNFQFPSFKQKSGWIL